MLTNVFTKIDFYCLNHDVPVPLYVYESSNSPFYACVRYMARDEAHPDGHEEGEAACANRLSFNAAAAIMEKISSVMEEALANGDITDWTGWQFMLKGIRVKVLEYSFADGSMKVGIENTTAIRSWR